MIAQLLCSKQRVVPLIKTCVNQELNVWHRWIINNNCVEFLWRTRDNRLMYLWALLNPKLANLQRKQENLAVFGWICWVLCVLSRRFLHRVKFEKRTRLRLISKFRWKRDPRFTYFNILLNSIWFIRDQLCFSRRWMRRIRCWYFISCSSKRSNCTDTSFLILSQAIFVQLEKNAIIDLEDSISKKLHSEVSVLLVKSFSSLHTCWCDPISNAWNLLPIRNALGTRWIIFLFVIVEC